MGASPCNSAEVRPGGRGSWGLGPAAPGARTAQGRWRIQRKSGARRQMGLEPCQPRRIPREQQDAGVPPRLWTGAKANFVQMQQDKVTPRWPAVAGAMGEADRWADSGREPTPRCRRRPHPAPARELTGSRQVRTPASVAPVGAPTDMRRRARGGLTSLPPPLTLSVPRGVLS